MLKGVQGKQPGWGYKKAKETRSGIQRAYRELRKKLENKEAFLEKESNGKRKSYIPASLLMESEQVKRPEKKAES